MNHSGDRKVNDLNAPTMLAMLLDQPNNPLNTSPPMHATVFTFRIDTTTPMRHRFFAQYRAYAMTGSARRLGLYGFGAAAHTILQVARQQGKDVYAFTGPKDTHTQAFALSLGVAWAGNSDAAAPALLDAAIIFAPDAGRRTNEGRNLNCSHHQRSQYLT